MLRRNYKKHILLFQYQKKNLIIVKQLQCKVRFIDSFRFMSTSLSSLVDNLSKNLHCDNCKDCEPELE